MTRRATLLCVAVALFGLACATHEQPAGTATVTLPADADHHLRTAAEIMADEVEIVLPTAYRAACSVVCDPELQQRRISRSEILLEDPSGLGTPPLVLQVMELRIQGRRSIKASFDDRPAQESRVLVRLTARGHVVYRGPDGRKEGTALSIRNADLSLAP